MKLRWYQTQALDDLEQGWTAGHKCQVLRMGTGTGKSATSAASIRDSGLRSGLMMAHRGEIVAQLALALAREGVRHRVIGPDPLVRMVRAYQIDEMGRHFVDSTARHAVASVQTMAAIKGESAYLRQIGFVVADEFHHFTTGGQFGKVLEMLPADARILGPTACTRRTDGRGLGRHSDGYADHMVLGPPESRMMTEGYLCPYRIFVPPTTFDRSALHLNAAGEFKAEEVKIESKRSTIFGDAAEHYVKHASGKLALQFCDSLDNAIIAVEKMRAVGVTSEVLSGKTHPDLRRSILKKFAARQIHHIASVSLIDEGFDCPAVEVVLDTAATTSLNRFRQRFGRGWRPAPGKTFLYFDFVGNVKQHGLPDAFQQWSLDRRERRGGSGPSDTIPVTTCLQCTSAYEAYYAACPYCGAVREPQSRRAPEQVDGVLAELDPDVLARMRGEVAAKDAALPGFHPDSRVNWSNHKHSQERKQEQAALRGAMTLWGGWKTHEGYADDEAQRLFFFRYGVDLLSAWMLDTADARKLRTWIENDLKQQNVVELS